MKENILNSSKSLANYKPLIIIIAIISLTSIVLGISTLQKDPMNIMQKFMGLFFVVFAMFKLLNVDGFVKGFKKYDLISQKFASYAYAYPFIELILGLGYLANIYPTVINLATFVIMSISSYSVIKSIKEGLNLKCACLGTILDVPLSTVSIIENVGMSLMSLIMLIIL